MKQFIIFIVVSRFWSAVVLAAMVIALAALNFLLWTYDPDAGLDYQTIGGQVWGALRIAVALASIFVVLGCISRRTMAGRATRKVPQENNK